MALHVHLEAKRPEGCVEGKVSSRHCDSFHLSPVRDLSLIAYSTGSLICLRYILSSDCLPTWKKVNKAGSRGLSRVPTWPGMQDKAYGRGFAVQPLRSRHFSIQIEA